MQSFKFIISGFLNFNFKICDSTLKLEMLGINQLASKLELELLKQVQVELALQARLQLLPVGSCCAAQTARQVQY